MTSARILNIYLSLDFSNCVMYLTFYSFREFPQTSQHLTEFLNHEVWHFRTVPSLSASFKFESEYGFVSEYCRQCTVLLRTFYVFSR